VKITYEIKNIDEFKKLPILSKIGFFVFLLGVISFASYFLLDFFNISFILQVSPYFPIYSLGVGFLGFIILIFFDKGRKNRTKIGPLKGPR
jgi:amino acid transporter